MKKILLNISLFIFIILTVFNSIFLIEAARNKDISRFYYESKELPDNYLPIEKTHMQEVKHLVNVSIGVDLIFLTLVLILSKCSKLELRKVGILLLFSSVIMAILSFSFLKLFNQFHLLLFNSNNWLLPADSVLIQTYPISYFTNIFILIITIIACIGAILIKGSFKTKTKLPEVNDTTKKNTLE